MKKSILFLTASLLLSDTSFATDQRNTNQLFMRKMFGRVCKEKGTAEELNNRITDLVKVGRSDQANGFSNQLLNFQSRITGKSGQERLHLQLVAAFYAFGYYGQDRTDLLFGHVHVSERDSVELAFYNFCLDELGFSQDQLQLQALFDSASSEYMPNPHDLYPRKNCEVIKDSGLNPPPPPPRVSIGGVGSPPPPPPGPPPPRAVDPSINASAASSPSVSASSGVSNGDNDTTPVPLTSERRGSLGPNILNAIGSPESLPQLRKVDSSAQKKSRSLGLFAGNNETLAKGQASGTDNIIALTTKIDDLESELNEDWDEQGKPALSAEQKKEKKAEKKDLEEKRSTLAKELIIRNRDTKGINYIKAEDKAEVLSFLQSIENPTLNITAAILNLSGGYASLNSTPVRNPHPTSFSTPPSVPPRPAAAFVTPPPPPPPTIVSNINLVGETSDSSSRRGDLLGLFSPIELRWNLLSEATRASSKATKASREIERIRSSLSNKDKNITDKIASQSKTDIQQLSILIEELEKS